MATKACVATRVFVYVAVEVCEVRITEGREGEEGGTGMTTSDTIAGEPTVPTQYTTHNTLHHSY